MSSGRARTSTTFNPYDTTLLHAFIKESFHGATLLEEHQVSGLALLPPSTVAALVCITPFNAPPPPTGCCDVPASQCWCHLVHCVQAAGGQQGEAWHSGLLRQPDHTGSSKHATQHNYSMPMPGLLISRMANLLFLNWFSSTAFHSSGVHQLC